MKIQAWTHCFKRLALLFKQEGQDLVEYALVVALIAFAAAAGMNSLASSINTTLSNVGAFLVTNTN